MGLVYKPMPVELVLGMLASIPGEFQVVRELVERRFGPVELQSDLFPFDATHYYDQELGTPIQKQFLSFSQLIDPGDLAACKCFTNELEELRARGRGTHPQRPVNLDPGYLDAARLVLATTKDRSQRIYLGLGIYAEVTLIYERKAWRALPWTYADYAGATYHPFLDEVRGGYLAKLGASGSDRRDG